MMGYGHRSRQSVVPYPIRDGKRPQFRAGSFRHGNAHCFASRSCGRPSEDLITQVPQIKHAAAALGGSIAPRWSRAHTIVNAPRKNYSQSKQMARS